MQSSTDVHDVERCRFVAEGLSDVGYRVPEPSVSRQGNSWRVSPRPLALSGEQVAWLYALGPKLHAFNVASNELYLESVAGRQPPWIARYLDQGKPGDLIRHSLTRHVRSACPTVIRPDVIPTPDGMLITELDAVPGGMGVIARSAERYNALGHALIGDDVTVPGAFAAMIRAQSRDGSTPRLAIVVSDESAAYRPEMAWLAERLCGFGIDAHAVTPGDLSFCDDGVRLKGSRDDANVNVVYRFFELFDLPNIPSADKLMLLNAATRVAVVPPLRPVFEEKMWFALFRHPLLTTYWRKALGADTCAFLQACIPPTWILDPEPIPPSATIPGLLAGGTAVNSWTHLENLGRSQRHFVIKPSGFSERAWGSRGVVVGHDISTPDWNAALRQAVLDFGHTPHVLQEFRSGRQFEGHFFDVASGSTRTIPCRVRLCPYYFVIGQQVKLASVMATMCPLDKKKIHGMPDAIIVPCNVDGKAVQ